MLPWKYEYRVVSQCKLSEQQRKSALARVLGLSFCIWAPKTGMLGRYGVK